MRSPVACPTPNNRPCYNNNNFDVKDSQPQNTTYCGTLIKMFVCPSDGQTQAFNDGGTVFGGTNYGSNDGDWYIFGGFTGATYAGTLSRGAFACNTARTIAAFSDGTSNTIFFSEIKSFQFRLKCSSVYPNAMDPDQYPRPQRSLESGIHGRRFLFGSREHDAHPLVQWWRVSCGVWGTCLAPEQEDHVSVHRGPLPMTPAIGSGPVEADRGSPPTENDGGPTHGACTTLGAITPAESTRSSATVAPSFFKEIDECASRGGASERSRGRDRFWRLLLQQWNAARGLSLALGSGVVLIPMAKPIAGTGMFRVGGTGAYAIPPQTSAKFPEEFLEGTLAEIKVGEKCGRRRFGGGRRYRVELLVEAQRRARASDLQSR